MKKRKQEIWYLWQIPTAVKYIQILRQHTTHRKKHQVLFATTRKSNKKLTHFLKEAFLLMFFFFKSSPTEYLKAFLLLLCSYLLVFSAILCFCTRIYHLKQASRALVNITNMFFFIVVFFSFFILYVFRFENERKSTNCLFVFWFCLLFAPDSNHKELFNTPDRKSWKYTHIHTKRKQTKKTKLQIVTRKATVRWETMLLLLFFLLTHLLKKHSCCAFLLFHTWIILRCTQYCNTLWDLSRA